MVWLGTLRQTACVASFGTATACLGIAAAEQAPALAANAFFFAALSTGLALGFAAHELTESEPAEVIRRMPVSLGYTLTGGVVGLLTVELLFSMAGGAEDAVWRLADAMSGGQGLAAAAAAVISATVLGAVSAAASVPARELRSRGATVAAGAAFGGALGAVALVVWCVTHPTGRGADEIPVAALGLVCALVGLGAGCAECYGAVASLTGTGELDGWTRFVYAGPTLIGSSRACTIVIDGPSVLPLHARLTYRRYRLRIERATPEAQLMVNGDPVESRDIADGDEIALGASTFRVRYNLSRVPVTEVRRSSAALRAPSEGRSPAGPRLVGVEGPATGSLHPVAEGVTVIGRDASLPIVVPDAAVAARHITLMRVGAAVTLSAEGDAEVLVDGMPVMRARLQHGNQVRIGTSVFVYLSDDQ